MRTAEEEHHRKGLGKTNVMKRLTRLITTQVTAPISYNEPERKDVCVYQVILPQTVFSVLCKCSRPSSDKLK